MALQNEVSFSFYEELSISVAKATPPHANGDGTGALKRSAGFFLLAFWPGKHPLRLPIAITLQPILSFYRKSP
jgi:hypothetical protein